MHNTPHSAQPWKYHISKDEESSLVRLVTNLLTAPLMGLDPRRRYRVPTALVPWDSSGLATIYCVTLSWEVIMGHLH